VPEAQVHRATEVGAGSTHVITGTVGGRRLAFVSCFDSREVYVLDVESSLPRSVVRNLSGPFDLVLDEARERLYVADFRTSVVRVIDVSPVTTQADDGTTTAYVAATLGELRVVQELQ
jgi:DNA-binding beta-propeller fold protein YncE